MAKFLLRLFGGGAILLGIVSIVGGILTESGVAFSIAVYAGGGFLLFGAPLLGFARVITLLEDISSNTVGMRPVESPEDPRPGIQTNAAVTDRGTHNGYAYTTHDDGAVISRIKGAVHTWRTQPEFKAWADRQPLR